jgi:hypothetical protein
MRNTDCWVRRVAPEMVRVKTGGLTAQSSASNSRRKSRYLHWLSCLCACGFRESFVAIGSVVVQLPASYSPKPIMDLEKLTYIFVGRERRAKNAAD